MHMSCKVAKYTVKYSVFCTLFSQAWFLDGGQNRHKSLTKHHELTSVVVRDHHEMMIENIDNQVVQSTSCDVVPWCLTMFATLRLLDSQTTHFTCLCHSTCKLCTHVIVGDMMSAVCYTDIELLRKDLTTSWPMLWHVWPMSQHVVKVLQTLQHVLTSCQRHCVSLSNHVITLCNDTSWRFWGMGFGYLPSLGTFGSQSTQSCQKLPKTAKKLPKTAKNCQKSSKNCQNLGCILNIILIDRWLWDLQKRVRRPPLALLKRGP